MEEVTIFDKILAGDIPANKVYEDEHVLAFSDIKPAAPQHVLVVPKKKRTSLASFADASDDEIGPFIRGIARCASALGLEQGGYRVVFNTGRDAQQSVAYVHAHILGGRPLAWPPG